MLHIGELSGNVVVTRAARRMNVSSLISSAIASRPIARSGLSIESCVRWARRAAQRSPANREQSMRVVISSSSTVVRRMNDSHSATAAESAGSGRDQNDRTPAASIRAAMASRRSRPIACS